MTVNFIGKEGSMVSLIDLFDTMGEAKVYNEIAKMCDKEDMLFYSVKGNRLKIVERTGLSEITVKHSLKSLVEKGLIIKIERAAYRLNPKYLESYMKSYVNK